jgi:tetratricopeptide (TPR) repeat protein
VIRGLVDDLANRLFMIGPADQYYRQQGQELLRTCLAPVADELLYEVQDGVQDAVQALSIFRRVNANTVQALERALEIAPGHRPSGFRMAWALGLAGRHDDARRRLEQLGDSAAADAQWLEYAAMLAGLSGDTDLSADSYVALKRLGDSQRVSPWSLARAAAAAGEADEAIAWLEQAALERSSSVPFLLVTPAFRSLRGDPRFTSFVSRLGLPTTPP